MSEPAYFLEALVGIEEIASKHQARGCRDCHLDLSRIGQIARRALREGEPTPPPPGGERCAECGQEADHPLHEQPPATRNGKPLSYTNAHPFQPAPPEGKP